MRRQSSRLCVLFLAAVWASAQAPPQVDRPASVEGTVTNALTGEPVLRAHVAMRGNIDGKTESYGAVTTAEGKFSITVKAGRYFVSVDRAGFVMPVELGGFRGIQLMLRPGDKKESVKLRLTPTGAVTGRVLDIDGQPMEYVTVRAETGSGAGPATTTDDKGQFRIGGLIPGKYRIRASFGPLPLPPEIRTDGSKEVHYVPTYFPNAPDTKSATRLDVKSGAEIGAVEIRMLHGPMVRVSGTIAGLPAGQTGVALEFRQRNSSRGMGNVKKDGTFEVWNMEPGKYRLSASWMFNGQKFETAPVDVEIGQTNVENLILRSISPFDLQGSVEFDDAAAKLAPGANQRPSNGAPPPKQLSLRLALREVSGGRMMQVEVPEEGSFQLQNVNPGRYRVIPSWPNVYVKSLRLGRAQFEGNILDLGTGSGGGALSVVISSAMSEVSGKVSDEKGPAVSARVAMLADDADPGTSPSFTTTQPDGSFYLRVPPGKYKLAALDDDDVNMQGLEDYEDILVSVELLPGGKVVKDLKRHGK